MPPPFVVFALPRSRTAWLARFLSYRGWVCHHDLAIEGRALAAWPAALAAGGAVETGAVLGWRALAATIPGLTMAVVRRPVAECLASLARLGIAGVDDDLHRKDALLSEVAALPGAVEVTFDELRGEEACRRLFEHCLGEPFDRQWWETLAPINIQIDMAANLRTIAANAAGIQRLKQEVAAWA